MAERTSARPLHVELGEDRPAGRYTARYRGRIVRDAGTFKVTLHGFEPWCAPGCSYGFRYSLTKR